MKPYSKKLNLFFKFSCLFLLVGCPTKEILPQRLNTRKNRSDKSMLWLGVGASLGAGLLITAALVARRGANAIGEEFGKGAIDGMAQGLTIQHPALRTEVDKLIEHTAEKTMATAFDLLENKYKAKLEDRALRLARIIVEDQRKSSWPLRLFVKKQRL